MARYSFFVLKVSLNTNQPYTLCCILNKYYLNTYFRVSTEQNHRVCRWFAGCSSKETGIILKEIFQASYFRMTVVLDVQTVELCGALKVIIYT